VVFPGALICSYLAYLVGGTINNVTTTMFVGEPMTGWIKVVVESMAHMYMGAAFTYSAIKIAPGAPKHVARGAFAILIVFSALSVWSSFAVGKFDAVQAIIGLLFGGSAVFLAALAGQISPYGETAGCRHGIHRLAVINRHRPTA
jgi:hypothetical protein